MRFERQVERKPGMDGKVSALRVGVTPSWKPVVDAWGTLIHNIHSHHTHHSNLSDDEFMVDFRFCNYALALLQL